MMRTIIRYAALAGAIGLGACEMDVRNPNNPETERVLSTPRDAEALIGSYYRRWHVAQYGTLSNFWGMMGVMSFENYSSLANNCMNARAGIPRPTNDNSVSNACSTEQHRLYFVHQEVSRVANNVLQKFEDPLFTVGDMPQDERIRSFAEFLKGLSLGYVALFYDSAAVDTMGQDPLDPGVLVHHRVVMDSAIAALDRAEAHAVTSTLGIPQEWIPSSTTISNAVYRQLIHSYRARFRANLARTPAERADVSAGGIVNWTAVIADATTGITADHDNITNTTTGPFKTWVAQLHTWGLWHQMPPWIIGMADTSGSYASWIAQPLDQRGTGGAFFMVTPDLRFPRGTSRATQQSDFPVTNCDNAGSTCERYFRNRPTGNDQGAGLTWGQSNYDFVRYHPWRLARGGTGQNGAIPYFARAEVDMLAAEGYIRLGNYAAAAPLINRTRTAPMLCIQNCADANAANDTLVAVGGGLPPVTATVDGGIAAAGNACVPKVPVNASAAGGGTVACGNLFEAMKWEKRLETLQVSFGGWFLDMRGWGDLPQGTPLHWAPPFQELQARRAGIYSIGEGTTGGGAAGPSSYGW